MESPSINEQNSINLVDLAMGDDHDLREDKPVSFRASFGGCMEMYGDRSLVAEYLDAHEGWFCRCAQPMQVEPMGNNGYVITVGRFGSMGYEVEPKMAVVLHPPLEDVYLMESVPVPDYDPPGYAVNYRADMRLLEVPVNQASQGIESIFKKNKQSLPNVITKVDWQLSLSVSVQFPRFIYRLPLSFLQSTGDRFLAQIIRQISPRLTYKVQFDFHSNQNLPLPPKGGRTFFELTMDN